MQSSDVTMYGRDYSAREFSDEEFRRYMRENPRERPVQFLGRYIGYPNNRKCISAYPGMYQHHLRVGRPTFLFHQIGYGDMEGGFAAGRSHALTAKADAESPRVGWKGESHIVACMDRFYAKAGYRTLNAADLREYMRGFRSVLGDRTGFYGFYDSMRDAIREGWAHFYVQCGARSAHVPGIHCWQENNYQPSIFGTGTDILELYCDPAYAFGGTPKKEESKPMIMLAKSEDGPDKDARWWIAPSDRGLVKEYIGDIRLLNFFANHGAKTEALPQYLIDAIRPVEYDLKFVADIDEDKLAEALVARGIELGGADIAEIKGAFVEVLGGTRLAPGAAE